MINIFNTQRKVKITEEFKNKLQNFLQEVLRSEDRENEFLEINIILVNNKRIRELNREFLKRDRPTDVISFNLGDVGEIYLSTWTALERSKEYGWDVKFEIVRYALHGLLHILGYDHEKEEDAQKMEEKEETYLERWKYR